MSVGSGGLGTVYSRLPQSTSDIESSEDEVSQHENLIFYRKLGTPKKGNMKTEESSNNTMKDYQPLGHEGGSAESHEVHINGFSNINYNYAHGTTASNMGEETMAMGTLGGPSSNKKEGEVRHSNLQMLVGNKHPMSMMRQVAFVMSLCLCIFVIVAFLWVLPCNWSTCPIMHQQSGSSWERTLYRLELVGKISVVPSGNDLHNNLLFMIRGEMNFPERNKEQEKTVFANTARSSTKKEGPASIPPNGGGLITLMGSSGTVAWYKTLHSVPTDMDCTLLDFDGDGKTDCLLIGTHDLMYAFNPVTPTTIWYLNVKNGTTWIPSDMEFPLILPDLDEDNIPELAISCRMYNRFSNLSIDNILSKTDHNNIVLVSGRTGQMIGNPFVDRKCETLYKVAVEKDFDISYGCVDGRKEESVRITSLINLYKTATGKNLSDSVIRQSEGTLSNKQHIFPENYGPPGFEAKDGIPNFLKNFPTSYSIRGKKLTILNQGHCPGDCTASARVFDEVKGPNSSIWSDGGDDMYALHPAVLLFNSQMPSLNTNEKSEASGTDSLLGIVSGFAVKFWHWTSCDGSSLWGIQSRRHRRMSKEKDWESQPNDRWHDGTADRKPDYEESRETRMGNSGLNTTTKSLSRNISTITITHHPTNSYATYCLKERIVLVTFNDTDLHLVNASETEIKQLCSDSECQPDTPFQEQSLIIADLDGDGSKELVSYMTTYESDEDGKPPGTGRLILVSKVRVVRLEAELPKLYEAVTHL